MSPSPKALRANTGKPEVSQIRFFGSALNKLAKVMMQGRLKYPDSEPGVPNWTLGGKPDSEYLDAADRHITKFVKGEHFDDEVGTHHLAHAVWNLLALLENNYPDLPDLDPDFDQEQFLNNFTGSGSGDGSEGHDKFAGMIEIAVDSDGDIWFHAPNGRWYLWWGNTRAWNTAPISGRSELPEAYGPYTFAWQASIPEDAPWL